MKSSVEQDASKGNNIFSELDHKGFFFFFLLCRIISHSLFEGDEKENCISSPSPAPYFNKCLGRISCPLIWIISLWNGFFLPSPACFQFFACKEIIISNSLPIRKLLCSPFPFSLFLKIRAFCDFFPMVSLSWVMKQSLMLRDKVGYVEMTQDYWNNCDFSFLVLFYHLNPMRIFNIICLLQG